MAITLTPSNGDERDITPVGNYKAILIGIYDLGTDPDGKYGPRRQIVFTWELHKPGAPRPYLISRFFNLSFFSRSVLRQYVEAMVGRTFKDNDTIQLEQLLGTPCRIQVSHGTSKEGTPRAEIKGIMALEADEREPVAVGNPVYFEITAPNCVIPFEVPKWIADRVRKSPEYMGFEQSRSPSTTPMSRSDVQPQRRPSTGPVLELDTTDDPGRDEIPW